MNNVAMDSIQQARRDLTAILRWSERLGLNEGVCNHFSFMLPGQAGQYLINPQGLHWSEIRCSDLLVVDRAGALIEGIHPVEPTAFFIHSRVHAANQDARCVLHTHMVHATALTCVHGGRVEMCHQNSLRFYGRIAYDPVYRGLALDREEGDRICAALSEADVLMMAHHGVIVTGPDIATAFDDLYYLERACQHQVVAQSTGLPLRIIDDGTCGTTRTQLDHERQQSYLHLEAIHRVLKRESPEYLQ